MMHTPVVVKPHSLVFGKVSSKTDGQTTKTIQCMFRAQQACVRANALPLISIGAAQDQQATILSSGKGKELGKQVGNDHSQSGLHDSPRHVTTSSATMHE